MPAKRIIAALDVINNSVVKGINFENIKNVDDPVELAKRYEMEGIDEIVFLDITATNEKRNILKNLVKNVASEVYIPFTAGGGINSVENALDIIRNGADKIFIIPEFFDIFYIFCTIIFYGCIDKPVNFFI